MVHKFHAASSSVVQLTVGTTHDIALGSGFAVTSHHIVTAGHVVWQERPTALRGVIVKGLDGASCLAPADRVTYHPYKDLAVINIEHPFLPLAFSHRDAFNKTSLQVVQPWKYLNGYSVPPVQRAVALGSYEKIWKGRTVDNHFIQADITEGMSGSPTVAGRECVGMVWARDETYKSGMVLPCKDIQEWLKELNIC